MGTSILVNGGAIPIGDLATWVASIGAAFGLIAVAVAQVLWLLLARVGIIVGSNVKRGLSLVVPAALVAIWYAGSIFTGHDVWAGDRVWIWAAVAIFAATSKQIGWFVYLVIKGTAPPPGEDVPTLAEVIALLQSADWPAIIARLPQIVPIILAALFPPDPPPPPPPSPLPGQPLEG